MSPEFVIFDEPTCGLDPEGVGRFVELVDMLKQSGRGIIIISHDGQLLRRLTDRIVLLDRVNGCSQYDSSVFFENIGLSAVVSPSEY